MSFLRYLKELILKSTDLSLMLFKIMIPIIIGIKILEEFGFIVILSNALEPIMELVGLPGAMGLVWATTMMTGLFGGVVVFAALIVDTPMTLAQVTIISGMMLMAHSLPIELRVAQKVGVRIGFSLLLRVSMAIVFALLMNFFYNELNWLQQPVELLWSPEALNPSLFAWAIDQIINLLMIFIVVLALILVLDILKRLRIIDLLTFLIRPALKALGIGKEAETIILVGLTLGLSYGGALMIKEVEKGHVTPKEVLFSVSFLSLSHSLIEDTLLMMLISADISGILFARLLFSFIIIYALVNLVNRLSTANINRYFLHSMS
jgi:hypothetical protein